MLPATLVAILTFILDISSSSPVYNMQSAFITGQITGSSSGRNIRNLPCVSRKNNGLSGVCMFAIDCLKANGTHLGTCIDRFYFGSCCHIEPVKELENSIETNFILDSREPPQRIQNTTINLLEPVKSETTTKKILTTVMSTESITSTPTISSTITSSTTTTLTITSTRPPETTTVMDQKLQTFQAVESSPSSTTTTTTTQKPTSTTKASTKPPVTKPRPVVMSTTKKPFKPSSTTSRAPTTTKSPSKPAKVPSTTTKKPPSTTRKTYTTTKRVYTTTKKATTKKPAPPKPTKHYTRPPVHNTTSAKPVVTTRKPVQTTTSKKPTLLTKKPIISTTVATTPRPTTTAVTTTSPASSPLSTLVQEATTEILTKTNITKVESTSTMSSSSSMVTKETSTETKPPVESTPNPVPSSTFIETTSSTASETTVGATSTTTSSTTSTTSVTLPTTTTEVLPASTTDSVGLITWTVENANVNASTTKAPEITLVGNGTDEWVPITTPDGWILLPSVSTTEQAKNDTEPISTSSPAPDLAEIPLTITSNVTPLTTETTTSSAALSTTRPTITESSNVFSNTSAEAPATSTSSSVVTSTEEVTSRPVNMSDFTDVCGRRMWPEARIVGGEKSAFGQWPWQISLRQWRTSTYLHKCGAALLNENWAITAAHCVDNVPPSDLLLRLGEHDLSTETEPYLHEERRVQIVASHPNFDPRTFEYDLALLRFYEPVQFQPNIIPICVPTTDENFVGSTAHVTGWGRLYEDGPLPSVLQEVSVPVINNSVCETMYRSAGYIEHIPNIFICAGWRKGGFDSCEGDSGGPMVIQREDKRFLLAGIISWGIGCAEPNQPGVYTRISEFRVWINKILQF